MRKKLRSLVTAGALIGGVAAVVPTAAISLPALAISGCSWGYQHPGGPTTTVVSSVCTSSSGTGTQQRAKIFCSTNQGGGYEYGVWVGVSVGSWAPNGWYCGTQYSNGGYQIQ